MWNGREIRNGGLNIVGGANTDGIRGWDRTNLSTAPNIWSYSANGDIRSLASKSTSTWFIGGRGSAGTQVYRFHFEVVNTLQLSYTANGISI
jgi:hypothetical protein